MLRFVAINVVIASLLAAPVLAQDAKLIEAAKREGAKAIAYGSLESNTVEPIIEAFYKKTGIAVEYWRASATKVMDRALGELRAGKWPVHVRALRVIDPHARGWSAPRVRRLTPGREVLIVREHFQPSGAEMQRAGKRVGQDGDIADAA